MGRGIQQMRRSRSTSRVGGRVQGKVRAAKEYLNKNGLDSHCVAARLLSVQRAPVPLQKKEAPLALTKIEAPSVGTWAVPRLAPKVEENIWKPAEKETTVTYGRQNAQTVFRFRPSVGTWA